jgi:hypothetical protein
MPAGDTKASAVERAARRPIAARPEPRDDGPMLRAALNASYAMAYGSDGRPTEDPEKIRKRFAEFLGVDVASIGHAERRAKCTACGGNPGRHLWCSEPNKFEFVQLPDEPRDGKATSPRQRLEFFMMAPDVTKLPKAPEKSKR